ncbi:MAG TPA: GNAT family N-acetyltransferase [bacterium]|nr:GNAT family N-acetyltransferase [bacterium]
MAPPRGSRRADRLPTTRLAASHRHAHHPDAARAEILARFDAERADPPPEPGVRYERAGSVIRAIGTWNAVVFARLTADTADAAIAEQVAFFRSLAFEVNSGDGHAGGAGGAVSGEDRALEWKVYGHDLPADLGSRLAAAGFEPDEPETLTVFDLADDLRGETREDAAAPALVEIRRVTDLSGLTDFLDAARVAFGRDEQWQAARTNQFAPRLTEPAMSLYVAYADGQPVASARGEFPAGRPFAGLWGGGTIAEYRGRGIYRALVRARAQEARRRGYRYLRVDARETSRPILERLGFIALTDIIEWRLSLPARAHPA